MDIGNTPATIAVPHKKNPVVQHFRKYWQLWVMVFPGVLLILVFNYIPMYGIQLAFRDFDFSKGLTGGQFVTAAREP